MKFVHAGIDFRPQLAAAPDVCRSGFRAESAEFLVPFNTVTTDPAAKPRAAFWALNAYCDDSDFRAAISQRNLPEWCQDNYNTKLFRNIELWDRGLPPNYNPGGSIYYSNFVKLVLREKYFTASTAVEHVLDSNPELVTFFQQLARSEIQRLHAAGCKVFVCYGEAAYTYLSPVADKLKLGIRLIHEKHFSRYSAANTKALIDKTATSI